MFFILILTICFVTTYPSVIDGTGGIGNVSKASTILFAARVHKFNNCNSSQFSSDDLSLITGRYRKSNAPE